MIYNCEMSQKKYFVWACAFMFKTFHRVAWWRSDPNSLAIINTQFCWTEMRTLVCLRLVVALPSDAMSLCSYKHSWKSRGLKINNRNGCCVDFFSFIAQVSGLCTDRITKSSPLFQSILITYVYHTVSLNVFIMSPRTVRVTYEGTNDSIK